MPWSRTWSVTGSASRWWPALWIRCLAGCTPDRRPPSACARPSRLWQRRWTGARAISPTRCAMPWRVRGRRRSPGRCSVRSRADTRCWSTSSSGGQVSGGFRLESKGSTGLRTAGKCLTTRARATTPTRRCWPFRRRGCRVSSRVWLRVPRPQRAASAWPRRRWWHWRCPAALRCLSSLASWWLAENRCTPRR